MELVCPAGSLPALKAAVSHGADAVYLGFRNQTNARSFPGLNFDRRRMNEGLEEARHRGCKVYLAINTYAQAAAWSTWTDAVDQAAELEAGGAGRRLRRTAAGAARRGRL